MSDLVLEALKHISPATLTYQEWCNVGMALKAEGYDCSVWDDWSKDDSRYRAGACYKKWDTFRSDGLTGGTIVQMAKERGFYIDAGHPLEWDDIIERDGETKTREWDRKADLVKYLKTLFKQEEHVAFVTNDVYQDEEGKWKPRKGVFHKTVGEIIDGLAKHEFEDVMYDSKPACGAWICINPVDGKGRNDKNVIAYRYALVESDTMSLAEQEQFFRASGLPIATLVLSGGKSVHATVRVDAANSREYKERVAILYQWLKSQGLEVDEQNKNESRLTRMPGVYRNGREQRLIGVNIGAGSWNEWQANLVGDSLPRVVSSADFVGTEITLAPELVKGVLRQGHKLIISGESKAGKTWALIELGWAVATGSKWLDEYQCAKGAVLYLNLEVDASSFMSRINTVWERKNYNDKNGFYAWNLRGKAQTLDKLLPAIIRQAQAVPNLKLIIVDPIYKINPGDENSAGEMGAFCNLFDQLCEETGASVAFCHHFAKGTGGSKRSIDRASGSGVFARDPDAILTLTRLAREGDEYPAFRLESSLREFRDVEPLDIWFQYPIHVPDREGKLKSRGLEGSAEANLAKSSKRNRTDEDKIADFENAFEMATENDVTADLKLMAEVSGCSVRSLRDYQKLVSFDYELKNGTVVKKSCE